MTRPARIALVALVALGPLMTAPSAATAQSDPLRGLDAYVEAGMRAWEIPGLAIAVVRGDSVVYARGYGTRKLGSSEPVDANTAFAIGSASKAFTTAALGMLVDEDRMDWEDAVGEHLPGFQLHDPYATHDLTVRDLLTHRSGLSRGDAVWYATDFDRHEILERVRNLEPSWGFRSRFGYQNIMFLAAGQIVPSVTGLSWDDFIRDRIFTPLGMERSVTSTAALTGLSNVASPHGEVEGEVQPIPWRNIDNVAPAGSIISSANDMAHWVRLHLGAGTHEGERLLSEDVVAEMHAPVTIVPQEGGWALMAPASNFLAYGLGWFLNDHRGRKVVQHGGNIDGMHALVGMMPEEDLGVVVLTNLTPNRITYALMYRIFDAYLGHDAVDWSGRLLARTDTLRSEGEAQRRELESARVAGTRPSLELADYAGTYRHPMYGDVTVSVEDEGLVMRRGRHLLADLDHWHFDTFRAVWHDPIVGRSFAGFSLDAAAEVADVEIQELGTFERVPAAEDEQ